VSRPGAGQEQVLDRAARLGLSAKGALYTILGLLAGQLAVGAPAEDASQQGAMRTVANQPFGRILLSVLALGLAGYAVWRLRQAVDPPASSLPTWLVRVAMVVRAAVYAGFAFLAAGEVLGAAAGDDQEQSTTAAVLALPGGVVLVVGVGLVIVAVGVVQFREAWTAGFRDELEPGSPPLGARRLVAGVGRIGHAARGAVFVAAGGFLVRAALRADPDEGVGLDAVLRELADAPAGPWALGAVAAGLVLYGVFCFLQAGFARPSRID
jgi:hypothetical protein